MMNLIIQKVFADGIAVEVDPYSLKAILIDLGLGTDPTKANFDSVLGGIYLIIEMAFRLASIIGFLMIIYAAILYALSFGDDAKAESAKKTLYWAIVGTLIVAIAALIVTFLASQLITPPPTPAALIPFFYG